MRPAARSRSSPSTAVISPKRFVSARTAIAGATSNVIEPNASREKSVQDVPFGSEKGPRVRLAPATRPLPAGKSALGGGGHDLRFYRSCEQWNFARSDLEELLDLGDDDDRERDEQAQPPLIDRQVDRVEEPV